MATYNGAKYISRQINSILSQLSESDEVIISDDGSTDETLDIIRLLKDNRIKLLRNNNSHSPVGNFENALRYAQGEYIVLADQDDEWEPSRISEALKLFSKDTWCVLCNRSLMDAHGNIYVTNAIDMDDDPVSKPFYSQVWHNPYIGCCLMFRRELLDLALPFPKDLPMHDLWIGWLGAKLKKNAYTSKPLVRYRRHGENVTTGKSPYSIVKRISYRLKVLGQLHKRVSEFRSKRVKMTYRMEE